MVFARQAEPPSPGSPAAGRNGGHRLTSGGAPVPPGGRLEGMPEALKSRERYLRGVGCAITVAPREGERPSWRCVVELPTRMEAAAVMGAARSRDEAVADAFRKAEVALGWISTAGPGSE